jgi:hypothetical protein
MQMTDFGGIAKMAGKELLQNYLRQHVIQVNKHIAQINDFLTKVQASASQFINP